MRPAKYIQTSEDIQSFLAAAVRGLSVLDVGCVAHHAQAASSDDWLHKNLCATADRVVGLDINAAEVEKLNRLGYHIIPGDATAFDIEERFDIVVAGEILEHVENPGMLIRTLKRHLKPGGKLFLSTPNVFFALHFAESLLRSPERRWNEEHVAWWCNFTLNNLIRRCGLEVVESRYFARSRKTRRLLRLTGLKCPRFLASTLLVTAVDPSAQNGHH